ncbi:MAG: ComF family protein [Spirulina sp. SIO3F2]|nr:ComF family protein [Spirulina sp. SIO3F2]
MDWWQGFLNLVFKYSCALCRQSADEPLCPTCQTKVQQQRRLLPKKSVEVLAWGNYGKDLRSAIAALKYRNNPQVAELFGHWLGDAWLKNKKNKVRPLVVPIPMNPSKRRDRGFDQAELLARSFSHYTHLPYCAQGLERIKQTEALYNLDPRQRQHTMQDAFALGPAFRRRRPQRPILLVDDIFTTGSTARAATKMLRKHGISVQGMVVLAVTPRKTHKASTAKPASTP